MVTPVFGRREIPLHAKIGISALISYIIYNFIPEADLGISLWQLTFLTVKEVIVGLAMGYITLMMFSSLYIAGELIDMEMGFGMVNVIDPQSNTQIPLMGNFFHLITIMIFLTVDGHHVLISSILKSFEIIPLGKAYFKHQFISAIAASFSDMFLIGIKVSLPIISIVFLVDIALGIIARTVPQMNIFLVGLPVKITAGILGIIFVLPMYLVALDVIFNGTFDNILKVIEGMWGGP